MLILEAGMTSFDGVIDEVKVYDFAVSAEQVSTIYGGLP
jgi:hypothetical protein